MSKFARGMFCIPSATPARQGRIIRIRNLATFDRVRLNKDGKNHSRSIKVSDKLEILRIFFLIEALDSDLVCWAVVRERV